jgi:hypothetical protein
MSQGESPKIQIDSDWKAEAQREKERLAQQSRQAEAAKAPPAGARPAGGAARREGQMPPASFDTLISTMATQALLFMGAIPDPRTGQRIRPILDLARHHVDMLGVIEDKSKGNLTDDEQQMLSATLYELRQRYIQLSMAARQK